ncbi:Carboxypeptidase Y -like protein [Colletotrichum tanaceti]|uniref:Carboxypeptidase Y-like protein n=1 Tax=Colletotrichum tanaceti TaxID=1306861 RepID=A0A4U6XR76_9PEZI|nr:Carboxypeptidase Y -like protein [Colletotrichum tanaceti]TKW58199.1 Carboxypeptidase Y -like protein [Colletotrichum tanaceti]
MTCLARIPRLPTRDARDWQQCINENPFGPGGDQSADPFASGALTRVSEHTNNLIVASGNLDYRVPTNGKVMVLQNTAWNGGQCFDEFPFKAFSLPTTPSDLSSQSAAGKTGDRVEQPRLTFARVFTAGYGKLCGYRTVSLLP